MPCSSPVSVGRWTYSPAHGGRIKRYVNYPCGKCLECLKSRQMQYAFRAEWEALDPTNVCILFCTFTYAPEFLLDNELSKSDFQHYIRRLKLATSSRVRYMCCGEYGEKYGRKHLHAILYFDKFIDYHFISDCWTFGIVDVAPFTPARAGYVAKYSVKQLGSKDDEFHKVLPFILVSNSLGSYFLTVHGDYVQKNYISHWQNLSGLPVKIPRVFMERLFPPKDKRNFESSLLSRAKLSSGYFLGSVNNLRFRNKLGYDLNLRLKTALSGLTEWRYKDKQILGASFKSFNQCRGIMSRVAYEIGRY